VGEDGAGVAAGQGLPHIGGEGGDEQQGHRGRKVEHRRQQAETDCRQAQADHALDGACKQEGGDDSRNGRRIEHAGIPARAGASEPAPRPALPLTRRKPGGTRPTRLRSARDGDGSPIPARR